MVAVGIGGQNVRIPIHVVEGPTPMLLSSPWLEEQGALIDFKTGQERASTNCLMLKVDDFQDGNRLGWCTALLRPWPKLQVLSDSATKSSSRTTA